MNLVELFVRRPVATTLLTIGVSLAGIGAFTKLPVAPLPQVAFPTIAVSASVPGASPEVMAATVATPLERAMGRIAGVTEMTSSSSLGSTRVILQFDLSRDINAAANEVQAAIQAARVDLPTSLTSNPTYRKLNPADAPVMIMALTSDRFTRGQMYDIASTVLAQRISQVSGVGQVTVGGGSLPSVRVELQPSLMNSLGITFEDVRAAISNTNANKPKGFVDDETRHWEVRANDQAKTAKEYIPIIVAYRNGGAVRLGDLGEVVDSVQDLRNYGAANGKPAVLLIVNLQPDANIIEVVDNVQALMPELRATLPADIKLDTMMERTSTIRASLKEVERTLAMAVALVILVVFAFLRNWRAALIPTVAVPVSILGTFGIMFLLGYSLNNLSLMALVIATGFVVDDAIVVLENVSRHIEAGETPFKAALKGAREVSFTVVSMSISLVAVFIPILFMGGIIGRLFREFAVTLSVAIGVSLVVSLTTTPMMCAFLLTREDKSKPPGRFARASEAAFGWMLRAYDRTLGWALRFPIIVLAILVGTVALNIYLYTIVPKGFFPQQDTGRVIANLRADQSSSFQATRDKLEEAMAIVMADPAVENVTGFIGGGGFGGRNTANMFIALKPLKQRGPIDPVLVRMRAATSKIAGANVFLNPIQDLRAGGREAPAAVQFTLRSDSLDTLREWAPKLEYALRDRPELADVSSDQQARGLQTSLVIDRPTAARLGITPRMIDSTLNLAFGQAQVSTVYQDTNQYKVVMEASPEYGQNPQTLQMVYVLSPTKGPVPLSQVARFETTLAPLSVNHQGTFAATTVSFNLQPGIAMSEAADIVRDTMARIAAPSNIYASFEGTAKQFQSGMDSQPLLILAALITVYLVLGMLYESTVHPITILSTLPSAGVGALLALLAFKVDLSLIALIGVILLIGIVKKNAILMIDFALDAERRGGKEPHEAIREACLLRFRPILMTTLAAMLAAIPLAVGFGDGAELRQPLGISILGGLLVSQMLTLYTTPVVYLELDRARLWFERRFRRRAKPALAPQMP
ncbi:multidrug transporter subunit MdtC [Betaproteobacteria bacterium GR16-43]|nr:multidrug transporter subunit MdtC [Betaproteobacteria bacterium GR16-43]